MPKNLTDTATYTAAVTVPVDGDALNAASVESGFQDLADRTEYLRETVDAIVTVPFALPNAIYSEKSLDVSTQETQPFCPFFSTDGLAMYVVGGGSIVYQYTLSTAWDVSTATYASKSFDTSSEASVPLAMFIGNGGTRLYILDSFVYQYTLSTAWDISTASYDSKSKNVTTEESDPRGLYFKSDGTTFWAVGATSDTIYEYTMSTAWDVSTASYATVSLSVTSEDTAPAGVWFSNDGLRAFINGGTNETVYEYRLSTAWDVSTGAYSGLNFDYSHIIGASARALVFNTTGGTMLITRDTGTGSGFVYQFYTRFAGAR